MIRLTAWPDLTPASHDRALPQRNRFTGRWKQRSTIERPDHLQPRLTRHRWATRMVYGLRLQE